ncbi:DUF1835 domain-containing protein [Paenibacillus agaridevorans]|uniref:DUF1835 domain-containing protein n=1 Tax=Paenibacillus agaridevorans TaxID=171404 RepID=UPI001BE498A5|nr:DUF3658 domain-containing protein [Paenibacillus agaridevorans]
MVLWWICPGEDQEHQLANMVKAIKNIPENKIIVIWCADNAHDHTGLRFVLHLLRERKKQVNVANVTELCNNATGFQNKEGTFPYASGLNDREHFQAIVRRYHEGIPLNPSQRKRYESEWLKLSGENHVLRSSVIDLEHEQDEDGFIRAGIVVGKVFDLSQQLVGHSYISYRIWRLVDQGVLKFRGLPGALHQFSVKLGNP